MRLGVVKSDSKLFSEAVSSETSPEESTAAIFFASTDFLTSFSSKVVTEMNQSDVFESSVNNVFVIKNEFAVLVSHTKVASEISMKSSELMWI